MSDQTMRSDDPLHPDQLERSQRRVRRHARRARRRRAQRVVYAIALLAAIGAALADGAPTGLTPVDIAYRALFAALVVLAAAQAKRWTWFLLAGIAGAVGSDDLVPLVLSALALCVAFGSLRYGRRQREFGAVVGALTAQALLRLPTDLTFAIPTIAAIVATLPVFASALRNVRRPRRYIRPVLAGIVILGAIGAAFVAGMLTVQSHAQDGVIAARDGLDAASGGEDAASVGAFTVADREFGAAVDVVDAWWMLPSRVVPVLAQHVDAVREVAQEGQSLAGLGADQAAVLDIRGLSDPDGGFDLVRIAELSPRATGVADALERASNVLDDTNSPWLVALVADRLDEFADEVTDVAPTARLAADALALAPDLLGADGPQTYVTLIGNPAESRELGGFVGAVGVLTADNGSLDFDSLGSISGLNGEVAESGLTLDEDLPPSLTASDPGRFVQNWANTTDFRVVTEVATQLGPAFAGADVDGVVYVDPYALAGMLEITGPVAIEGRGEPLRAEDAVDYLLRGQYLSDDFDDDGERKDRLRDAAEAAFDKLTSSALPDPRRLAETLSPLVRARRLLFSTADETAHELLGRVGLRQALDLGAPDQLLLAQENLRANKLDAYLERSLTYDLEVEDDGTAAGTLTVELTNSATDEGLPDYVTGDGGLVRTENPLPEGLHRISLDLYSRLDVVGVTIDGASVGQASSTLDGLVRTSARVDIPAGSTVTVVFALEGVVDMPYALDLVPNGTATTDSFSAAIRVPGRTLETTVERVTGAIRLEREA